MDKPGRKPGSSQALPPHDTITEGEAIGVLLSNRPARVWLDRADYDRIVATYGTRAWAWVEATRYVRIRPSRAEDVPVARLVLESEGSGYVHFGDGDRLNLRRKNVSIQSYREQGRVMKVRPTGNWGTRPKEAVKAPLRQPRLIPRAPAPLPPKPASKLPERPPITVVQAVKRACQRGCLSAVNLEITLRGPGLS